MREAMRRLVASGLLPERAGQPVKAVVHVSLAERRAMDDGSVLETEWVTRCGSGGSPAAPA
jgi:DNA-binding FadR family transcriptional regulator